MQRNASLKLLEWLKSTSRKPLVLRGARQVGKTWLVRELAKNTKLQLVEINFEKQRNLAIHFESNDPKTILLNLERVLNQVINSKNTILFLDEIQAVPEILAKLRWFYEEMPELAVIAAGSLLEFVLEKHSFSMPVGRIEYFFIEPLGFEEFLLAKNERLILQAIHEFSFDSPVNQGIHEKIMQLFKEFIIVGGMPEAVACWVTTNSLEQISRIHNNLINTYQDDFTKYAGGIASTYLESVLFAVPKMLTQKFVYSQVDPHVKNASIKQASMLLSKARLCHKVKSSHANGVPLGAEVNTKVFKMLLLDVGLVSTILGISVHHFQSADEILLINKGAIAEQVAGQLLRLLFPYYIEPQLYYWNREIPTSIAEIDYVIQNGNKLIPIEVKAGGTGKLRSLHQFMSEKPWKQALRIYAGMAQKDQINFKTTIGNQVDYELISLPFYLISQIPRLVSP